MFHVLRTHIWQIYNHVIDMLIRDNCTFNTLQVTLDEGVCLCINEYKQQQRKSNSAESVAYMYSQAM